MNLTPGVIADLEVVVGSGGVSTDAVDLEATSHDTWPLTTKWAMVGRHPNQADVLVHASWAHQIAPVLAIASREGIPVTVRALGSSVTGQPLPVRGGMVLDVSGIPASFDVNERNFTVTASASYNGGALEAEMRRRGLTLGMSPQSLHRSSVGGWLATLATGQFSSLYGGIEDLVVGYVVILATGETIELSASPRAAMGPDLRQLFLGSEGTLGVITSVTLKVFPVAPAELVQTFTMPSVSAGLEFLRDQVSKGLRPFLVRFYDLDEARHAMADENFSSPVLFVGTRGLPAVAEAEMTALAEIAERLGGAAIGPEGAQGWLERRYDFSTVEKRLATPGGFAETIEVAHNWDQLEGLYSALKEALAPLANEVLAHFSHVYNQGSSMYLILLGKMDGDDAAIERIEKIWETTMQICLDLGAELSHHHGGGLARSPYASRSLGSAHLVLGKVKRALDPEGILNPGKLGL